MASLHTLTLKPKTTFYGSSSAEAVGAAERSMLQGKPFQLASSAPRHAPAGLVRAAAAARHHSSQQQQQWHSRPQLNVAASNSKRSSISSHSSSSSSSHRMSAPQASSSATVVRTTPFASVKTQDELVQTIRGCGLPERAIAGMEIFYHSYLDAVKSSGVADAEEVAVRVMGTVFDRVMLQFVEPYTFPSHHLSMREPYDYYAFGQNYVRPLIDYKHSYVGNPQIFDEISKQVAEGHNVVLLANHQTEADPAVMALMLEDRHPDLATALTYVAGDRVVLDPFCKPFSMGRNLLCVYSKKRMNDVPELMEQKLAANRRTLKEMAALFKRGGNFIWVAPSGGRDRPDPVADHWSPAVFDPSAVELFRRLASDSDKPFHLHPTALLCYDIMPPPRTIEKELGEKRIIGYHGVGISVAPAVEFNAVAGNITDRKEARDVFSSAVFDGVVANYNVLFDAVHGGKGLAASTPDVQLSQPWFEK